MPTAHLQINPRLISIMTGETLSVIKDKPTMKMIPSEYAKLADQYRERIALKYPPNEHMLHCTHCHRKGKYDLGLVLVDSEKIRAHSDKEGMLNPDEIMDWIQPTGYFRCKQCNSAGSWTADSTDFGLRVLGSVLTDPDKDSSGFVNGQYALYDGMIPSWATDAEEHLLNKLEQNIDQAFVWNRLGNMYYSGGRPELAVAAFEQSLKEDKGQMESHFSLANLLYDIDEWEKASFHYRQMFIYAQTYKRMKPEEMRRLLADGLRHAMIIHIESEQQIPFLPEKEELDKVKQDEGAKIQSPPVLHLIEMDLHPDDIESFYPLAESYMGKQKTAIPKRKRTLERLTSEARSHRNRKAKRKKRKKKKR